MSARHLFALVVLFLGVTAPRAHAAPVPAALERLIAPQPLLVIYAPSLEEVEREMIDIAARFDQDIEDGADIFDFLTIFSEDFDDLSKVVDPAAPAAVVFRLQPGTPAPAFSMVVPLLAGLDAAAVEQQLGVAPLATDGRYAALGTDPGYRPGGGAQPLLAEIGDDDLTARLDVAALFTALGPMVDMLVQMALSQPGEDGQPPRNAAEEVDAALRVVSLLRDGIETLEVSADVDDGQRLEIAGGVRFRDDGPLALGAQPALDDVWSHAALLPADADLLLVSGMDLRAFEPLAEAFVDVMGAFDAASGSVAFLEAVQDHATMLMTTGWQPHVASVDARDGNMTMRWVRDDPEARQTQIALRDLLNAADGMVTTTWEPARAVGGFDVWTADVALDPEAFELPADGADAPGAEERAAVQAMMDALLPPVTIAASDARLVMAMDPDPAAVDAFVKAVDRGPEGPVPAALERARAWAGPTALGVMHLDVAGYLDLVSGALAASGSVEAEEFARVAASLPETPVFGSWSVDGEWLRGRLSTETDAVVTFVEAMRAADVD